MNIFARIVNMYTMVFFWHNAFFRENKVTLTLDLESSVNKKLANLYQRILCMNVESKWQML